MCVGCWLKVALRGCAARDFHACGVDVIIDDKGQSCKCAYCFACGAVGIHLLTFIAAIAWLAVRSSCFALLSGAAMLSLEPQTVKPAVLSSTTAAETAPVLFDDADGIVAEEHEAAGESSRSAADGNNT
jgi:hypothetical protein